MDDLYDNLENYNDVNIVNELKCENKELKLKLEENSKAMVQLQKDFDKVSSEYKKLEINYSSLLKTARAEIKRKTEMINTLNLEKDTIILETLKNKGKRVFNAAKCQMYSKGLTKKDESTETVINKDKQNSEAPVETKIQKDNRVDSHHTPSVDYISSVSKENRPSISEERASKSFDSRDKNKNKENLPRVHTQSNENETNRRFTTPVNSHYEATFSSDEDSEFKNSDNIQKSPLRNEVQYYERQDNRDYRTELYEHYESLNESSRRRSSKYLHSERYKNADNYESHSRHRRHYSPERNQHRYSKEYTEYTEHYPPRGDYGRHRLTRSPPSDKYNRSKSRDRRFAYDRENYRDHDKHSTRFYEHASGKHKIRNEPDEPSYKRQKFDTYNKHIEEKNCYLNEKEREFVEQQRTHVPKPQECDFHESCQSPDYIVIDSTIPEHSVKEIMGTAATKLEDPRVSNKKYILSLPNNTLSTVVGRNIDLKMVDKSVWGIEKIDVPAALTKRTSEQESDILLKDIYMNIEDPLLHDSLKSGEIQSYDDNNLSKFYSREIDKDDGNETNNKHQNTDSGTRILTDLKEKLIDKKVSEKPQSNKFKIPKIKKPDLDVPKLQVKKTYNKADKNLPDLRDLNDGVQKHQPSEHNINTDDSDKLSFVKEAAKNIVIQNSEQTDSDKRKEIMKTIEGDLELSDEASDVELHKDTNQTWSKTGSDKVQNVKKDITTCPSFQENNSATIPHSAKISSKKTDKTKSLTISVSTKDSSKGSSKKRKRKRKSSEQNEIKESHDAKKTKEREYKQSLSEEKKEKERLSKETLSKFSDLFGDSSSLITPDDLGINNVPVQSAEKYSSIFENTQDAVDLSGEVVISKLTNKSDTIDTFNSAFDTVVEKVCDENAANKNNFNVNVTVVNDNVDTNAETKNVNSNNVYEHAKSEMSVNENSIVKNVVISSGTQNECVNDNSIVKTMVISSGTQNECANESSIIKTVVISSGTQNECVNDNSIVKTVVISSGTQNECVSESVSKDFSRTIVESVTANTDNVASKKCLLNNSKALATSTPQKCGDTVAPIEEVYEPAKLSKSSNVNDTIEQNEDDIPDVRIFVRRRRKPVKKPN